jgi:hypothetical protein
LFLSGGIKAIHETTRTNTNQSTKHQAQNTIGNDL